MSSLALFDFDGTITDGDSLWDFLCWSFGKTRMIRAGACLGPTLLAWRVGMTSRHEVKARLLRHFFYGWDAEKFMGHCAEYSLGALPRLVKPSALKQIEWHKANGHTVLVVSASIETWLKPWCDLHQLGLIATRVEVVDGRITGALATPNCRGTEKVRRLKEAIDLHEYSYVYAYGDSRGDREMLELANEPHYRRFTA